MNPVIRNILAFIAGAIFGSVVNMSIIEISSLVIQPPPGADVSTMEGLSASMPLFEPRHFLMPFLAHALGTLAGAWLAALLAASHKMGLALGIGVLFLAGGIGAVVMIPAPLWFEITDLLLAYIPMAWLGGRLAIRKDRVAVTQ